MSGSGDGTARVWKREAKDFDTRQGAESVLYGHEGDIYTVQFHPLETHVVTGGYDKVRTVDLTETVLSINDFVCPYHGRRAQPQTH